MSTEEWLTGVCKRHPELLLGTRFRSGVPHMWHALFEQRLCELEEAGAVGAGMRIDDVTEKYGSLRADLVGGTALGEQWRAWEVALEDRSDAIARYAPR